MHTLNDRIPVADKRNQGLNRFRSVVNWTQTLCGTFYVSYGLYVRTQCSCLLRCTDMSLSSGSMSEVRSFTAVYDEMEELGSIVHLVVSCLSSVKSVPWENLCRSSSLAGQAKIWQSFRRTKLHNTLFLSFSDTFPLFLSICFSSLWFWQSPVSSYEASQNLCSISSPCSLSQHTYLLIQSYWTPWFEPLVLLQQTVLSLKSSTRQTVAQCFAEHNTVLHNKRAVIHSLPNLYHMYF